MFFIGNLTMEIYLLCTHTAAHMEHVSVIPYVQIKSRFVTAFEYISLRSPVEPFSLIMKNS